MQVGDQSKLVIHIPTTSQSEADDANFYEVESERFPDTESNLPKMSAAGSRYSSRMLGTSAKKKMETTAQKSELGEKKAVEKLKNFNVKLKPEEFFQLKIDSLQELYYLLKDDRQAMASFSESSEILRNFNLD